MIAKMICHDETREKAINKTIRAINEYEITGLETTLGFCQFVMHHDAFRSGNFDTKFVEKYFMPQVLKPASNETEQLLAAALASTQISGSGGNSIEREPTAPISKWKKNRI